MTKTASYIEVNGRRYDAVSGAYVGEATKTLPEPAKAAKASPAPRRGRAIDGFMPSSKAALAKAMAKPPVAKAAPTREPRTSTRQPAGTPSALIHAKQRPSAVIMRPKTKPPVVKAAAKHLPSSHQKANALSRAPDTSKVLLRRAVPKPALPVKQSIKKSTALTITSSDARIERKHTAQAIDPARAVHATAVTKLAKVSRFGNPIRTAQIRPAIQPIAVAPHPEAKRVAAAVTAPDVFEKALQTATAHEQKAPKLPVRDRVKHHYRHQKSVFGVSAAILIMVIIGVFAGIANMSRIELEVASAHAGFQASYPAYAPSGFAKTGSISYGSKHVAVAFAAPDSKRTYKLEQSVSNWDSRALYDNVVATSGEYKKIESKGLTIYVYGDAQAAWVSDGILYQITGDARLNNADIANIATSV